MDSFARRARNFECATCLAFFLCTLQEEAGPLAVLAPAVARRRGAANTIEALGRLTTGATGVLSQSSSDEVIEDPSSAESSLDMSSPLEAILVASTQ